MIKKQIISLLVNNDQGVLLRVTGLFTRRGFNIESITAGQTYDERYTRMTIVVRGDEETAVQFIAQMSELEYFKGLTLVP